MPIEPSIPALLSRPLCSMTALQSARFPRSCATLTRPIPRSRCSARRQRRKHSSPCGNGARSLKGLHPSWRECETPPQACHAIAGPDGYEQIPALIERSKQRVANFYTGFEARLKDVEFVAGDRFSGAEITTLVTVDFAPQAFGLPHSGDK